MLKASTQQWLEKAAEDEAVVQLIVGNSGPWAMAAYHIQQAAEKRLKALLSEAGVPPPKSHDLLHLIGHYPGGCSEPLVLTAAGLLSSLAWVTRYPGSPPLSEQDVIEALSQLEALKDWIERSLS